MPQMQGARHIGRGNDYHEGGLRAGGVGFEVPFLLPPIIPAKEQGEKGQKQRHTTGLQVMTQISAEQGLKDADPFLEAHPIPE